MSRLRFKISMSLDGFVAGPGQSVDNPAGGLASDARPRRRANGFYRHLGWRESGRLDDGQSVFKKELKRAEHSG